MAEIVQANDRPHDGLLTWLRWRLKLCEPGFVAGRNPGTSYIYQAAVVVAGENVSAWAALPFFSNRLLCRPPFLQQRHCCAREWHSVHSALLGVRRGLRPYSNLEIELIPCCAEHLCLSSTRQ